MSESNSESNPSNPEISQAEQNKRLHEAYDLVITVLNAGSYPGFMIEKVFGAKSFIQQNIVFLDKIIADSKTPGQKANEAMAKLEIEVPKENKVDLQVIG